MMTEEFKKLCDKILKKEIQRDILNREIANDRAKLDSMIGYDNSIAEVVDYLNDRSMK